MASCNRLAQPCEIPSSIQELVLLSGQPEEITLGVNCLPSCPPALGAHCSSHLSVCGVPSVTSAPSHLLGTSSAGAESVMVVRCMAREGNGEEQRALGRAGHGGDSKRF